MEAIVHGCTLRLLLPRLPPRQQVVRHRQRKVDVHGGAARQRRGVAAAGGREDRGGPCAARSLACMLALCLPELSQAV